MFKCQIRGASSFYIGNLSQLCQKTWIDHETSLLPFQLEGFDLINIPRKFSKHGGLIIYVKDTFSYSILDLIPESEVFKVYS